MNDTAPLKSRFQYLREFRVNWRYLAAACVGVASSSTLAFYISNTFSPYLIRDFGWSKAQFSLLGTSIFLAIICLPLAGRMTDLWGVRRMATVGIILNPILYIACSRMSGSFSEFFLITALQIAGGAATGAGVYSRLIAARFERSRGLAFALAACSAPATGALISRVLARYIEQHGWRAGYIAVAAGMAAGGILALILIPRDAVTASRTEPSPTRRASRDYPQIFRNPAFRRIALGMLLCNLTITVQGSQLKLILLDGGVDAAAATAMLTAYAAGVAVGRLTCGVALDRFPSYLVSGLCLGLPSVGLFILAYGSSNVIVVGAAVLIVGLSTGAELDVVAYLIMRFFNLEVYSTVFGVIQPMASVSATMGALLLGLTLKLGPSSYSLFLYLTAGATLIGSVLFFMLRGCAPHPRADAVLE